MGVCFHIVCMSIFSCGISYEVWCLYVYSVLSVGGVLVGRRVSTPSCLHYTNGDVGLGANIYNIMN